MDHPDRDLTPFFADLLLMPAAQAAVAKALALDTAAVAPGAAREALLAEHGAEVRSALDALVLAEAEPVYTLGGYGNLDLTVMRYGPVCFVTAEGHEPSGYMADADTAWDWAMEQHADDIQPPDDKCPVCGTATNYERYRAKPCGHMFLTYDVTSGGEYSGGNPFRVMCADGIVFDTPDLDVLARSYRALPEWVPYAMIHERATAWHWPDQLIGDLMIEITAPNEQGDERDTGQDFRATETYLRDVIDDLTGYAYWTAVGIDVPMVSRSFAVLWVDDPASLDTALRARVVEHTNAVLEFVSAVTSDRAISFREETFLNADDLLYRGWTLPMIRELMPEPDGDGPQYYEQRVNAIEATARFRMRVRAAVKAGDLDDVIAQEILDRSDEMKQAGAVWPLPAHKPEPTVVAAARWQRTALDTGFVCSVTFPGFLEDDECDIYYSNTDVKQILYTRWGSGITVERPGCLAVVDAVNAMMPEMVRSLVLSGHQPRFGGAGIVSADAFHAWEVEAVREREATRVANEANRSSPIVQLAEKLGLHPKPSECTADLWEAAGPDGRCGLRLDTNHGMFKHPTSARTGDGEALRNWVADVATAKAALRAENERMRAEPIVQAAMQAGLEPYPSDSGNGVWYASCPAGHRLMELRPRDSRFYCVWCKSGGTARGLPAWVNAKRRAPAERAAAEAARRAEQEAAADAMRAANAADREAQMVRLAVELGLAPEPSDRTAGLWLSPCPAGGHELEIRPRERVFDCAHCRRRGGVNALARFVAERRG